MQGKLTIQDIARLAGVSKATVSRVLNHNSSVDPALRERVMRVVAEHGFVPNVTATGLAEGRTRLVGVLAPPLTWPSVSEMLLGVAKYIEYTSYEVVLYSISSKRNHSDVLDRILSMRMVSGLLAILPGELSQHLIARAQAGLPLVMIDDQVEPANIPFPWVGVDNVTSAYQATKHLLDQGYRRVAHISGPPHFYCALERYQGYCNALQEAGITPDPELVFQGRFDVPSGRRCALELFSRDRSTWPDAIFAGNDQMAYGVLQIAEERGVQVPDDIALVGFDDNLFSAHLRPSLTTIRQPFVEMGGKAIELLLNAIDPDHRTVYMQRKGDALSVKGQALETNQNRPGQPVHVQLPTSLIVRASSAARRSLERT